MSQQLPLPLIDTLKPCWRGIIVRTVLAAAIRVMHAAFGRLPECDGHLQCPDRQIASHAITHGPADDTTRVQVQDHSQMQPAFVGPHIADVTRPVPVWSIRCEVSIQQVRCDVELVVPVALSADCFAIACRAMVVTVCLRVRTTDGPVWRIKPRQVQNSNSKSACSSTADRWAALLLDRSRAAALTFGAPHPGYRPW